MKRLFPALFLLTFGILFAFMIPGLTSASAEKEAPRSIIGYVSDELTGESLPGVKVYCENSLAETYTDFDGMFRIPAHSSENVSLVFKYISYQDMRLEDVKLTGEPLQVCLKQ
jgi:hypothetical protein